MKKLYDFNDTKRHDLNEDQLYDILSLCLWEVFVISRILDLDYDGIVTDNYKFCCEEEEKIIKEDDPLLWLEVYFNEGKSLTQ